MKATFRHIAMTSSAALLFAAGASSSLAAEDLSYSYIEADYLIQDVDLYEDSDSVREFLKETKDGEGYGVNASFGFASNWFAYASYSDTKSDFTFTDDNGMVRPEDANIKTFKLGLGFHAPINDRVDFVASAGYIDVDLGKFYFGATDSDVTDSDVTLKDAFDDLNEDSSDGYTIDLGVRAQAIEWLELGAGVRYTDLNSGDDLAIVGNALFEINPNFGINLTAAVGDDLSTYGIGARYTF